MYHARQNSSSADSPQHEEMGVTSLAKKAKALASVKVHLKDGGGEQHVIIDGGFLNHRLCTKAGAASSLLFDGDIEPLVDQFISEIALFENRGYKVTLVFDGGTPPAKAGTHEERTISREASPRAAEDLAGGGGSIQEVNRLATGACVFDAPVNARLAVRLRNLIKGDVYIAPAEADPQLVVFQNIHLARGAKVYVYATDSDLIVLGVEALLYEIRLRNGQLSGTCIMARCLFQPDSEALTRDNESNGFLRLLHGLPYKYDSSSLPDSAPSPAAPLPETSARKRLLLYAMVVGNDYAKFKRLGPAAAGQLLSDSALGVSPPETNNDMHPQTASSFADIEGIIAGTLAECVLQHGGLAGTEGALEEVTEKLCAAYNMFRHALVWDPLVGHLRHFSGQESTALITRHTGANKTVKVHYTMVAYRQQ